MKLQTSSLAPIPARYAGDLIAFLVLFAFCIAAAWGQPVDARLQEIDSLLSKHFKSGEPGASVIVSQHGSVLFRKAYGMANTTTRTLLQPEMPLRVGSITKQFTAAAIMLLADQGKLSVSDALGKYFPQAPEPVRQVTIEHLLTHTSGIRNYTSLPNFGALMTHDVKVDEAIGLFLDAPLQFQPGQRFAYSNSNYFLLGAIIEKVSGLSYADFMQQQIFLPLQLHNTAIEAGLVAAAAVTGYTRSWKGAASVPPYSMSWPFAAGALRTSVDDLMRWDRSIAEGKLLKRASWDRMATDYRLNDGSHTGYGFGWFIRQIAGSQVLEHGGDIGGFSADTLRLPQEDLFIVVLANNDSHAPAPDTIVGKIARIMLRQ